jgi:hypothetical protein
MPVILANQEAEIRKITVVSQPRQIVHKTLSQKPLHKNRAVEWLGRIWNLDNFLALAIPDH